MATVPSLAATVHQRVSDALSAALPEAAAADPLLRRSDRADFQANGMLALAKQLKGNPRELAAKVAAALPVDGELIADIEVSGPGFLNITVADKAIIREPRGAAPPTTASACRTPRTRARRCIDYSQPNVAKEMHVGHLRSAVIGDAMRRDPGVRAARRSSGATTSATGAPSSACSSST